MMEELFRREERGKRTCLRRFTLLCEKRADERKGKNISDRGEKNHFGEVGESQTGPFSHGNKEG